MKHDPDRRRADLLTAAVDEFSSHGYAGARIERISSAAGVNRERLYSYFGSKRALFETVLADRLATALDATVVTGTGPVAAAAFAADYFDACHREADLARLVAWEGLELQQPIEIEDRQARASRKVDELAAALPGLSREQVEDLMLSVVTLCHGSITTPNLSLIIAGGEAAVARRRTAIAQTAAAVARG
jgi:AcrR family transcriptional regulator